MNKEKKRKYIFAQLNSLPNAFQYVEVTNYIKSLEQENEKLHNKIDKVIKRIELLGKFDGEHCTRNFKMMSADFNYLLKILKDSDVDE